MNNIYKYISFVVVSVLLSYIAKTLESDFLDKFSDNILGLLTTLFAINIASSTLIAGKLAEIQIKSGHSFPKTKSNLKNSFYEQICFIGVAFIASLLRESLILKNYFKQDYSIIICDSVIIFSFIIFLEVLLDIGKSLFNLLDFKDS